MLADAPTYSIVNLKRHAQRFGTEGILETAVEGGIGVEPLTDLILFCEDLKDKAAGRFEKRTAKQLKNAQAKAERAAKKLLGITDQED